MPIDVLGGINIKKTSKYGFSLFTSKPFRKNEVVFTIAGPIVKKPTIYTVPIDFNLFIDPLPPGKYLNHSCEPSCGIRNRTQVTAMKNLKKGEEITIDYAMIVYSYDQKRLKQNLTCKCGSKICRGKFGSYKNLHKELRKKYRGFISDYLLSAKKS